MGEPEKAGTDRGDAATVGQSAAAHGIVGEPGAWALRRALRRWSADES